MTISIKYGLVLGVVVAAFGFVLGVSGLHTNQLAPMGFVIVAIIINAAIVVLAVRRLASTSTWVQQVANGLVLGLVGAVVVFLGSWLMTAVVLPDYYAEFAEAARLRAVAEGLTGEQLEAAVAMVTGTSVGSAFQGAVGTVITSVVVAGIAGIFKHTGKG